MERTIIFKNTETGEELVMPVTPKEYQVEHGRKQNTVTMHTVGDVTYPGPAVLLDEEPEFLLPAHDYPFNRPGAVINPFVYLEKLEKWSDAGTVLRWVVSGTPVNAAVRLGPIRYREEDGTNDIRCIVPIRGVRQLAAEEVERSALSERPVEGEPVKAQSYTVEAGDTLSSICLRFYGDASLGARLGAYNGIKNINLISVGQVLQIPDKSQLPAAAASTGGKVNAPSTAEAVTLTVMSFGLPLNLGNLMAAYIDEKGTAGMMIAGKGTGAVTVRAKKGTKVNLALAPNNKGRVDHFTVAGARVDGAGGKMETTADGNKTIGVYWGTWKS